MQIFTELPIITDHVDLIVMHAIIHKEHLDKTC